MTGSRRAYVAILLLVTVFIVYGSLFPFEYREQSYTGGPVVYLLSTWRGWDRRGDLLSNILLYLPFGFFGASALPLRIPTAQRWLAATIVGTVLSCGMEVIQFHDVGRVTSMGDVYANAIGSGVGALAGVAIGGSVRWPFVRELAAHPAAFLLLVMFFGYRLYPYVPVIDLHKYWHAVRPMLLMPGPTPYELSRYVITWLFIAAIIGSLYGYRRFLILLPLLCGCEFLGKVLIIDNTLTLTDVMGAGAAYLLWALPLRWIPGRFAIMALLFAGMITAQRLEPFEFVATPHSFGWVPFLSFMVGSIHVDTLSFYEKFYEYGGLIWLLARAGMIFPIGTLLTAMLLLATSYAECWLPGRSAEITDAVMALAIGSAFAMLPRAMRLPVTATEPNVALHEHASRDEPPLVLDSNVSEAPRRRGRRYAPYVPPQLRG